MTAKILNLGCGGSHLGHISVVGSDVLNYDLDTNAIWKDVRGDAHKLPFKDKCFDVVYCSHLIEHLYNPLEMLREVKRVCNFKVIIKTPNAIFYKFAVSCDEHIYSWNLETFLQFLELVFPDVYVEETLIMRARDGFFRRFFNWVLVSLFGKNELRAVCYVY